MCALLIHNRYKILGILGSGNYGKVSECLDQKDGKIKVLKDSRLLNPGLDKVYRMEVAILNQLEFEDHPEYFPIIYEHFVINSKKKGPRGFLIMEKLGNPVRLIRMRNLNKSFSEENVFKIALCVGEGLKYLHEANILHRDLSENNIVFNISLNSKIPCKIIDFGSGTPIRRADGSLIAKPPEFDFTKSAHNSLACNWMMYSDERDDWESFFYLILALMNKFRISGTHKQVVGHKLDLYFDPERYLKNPRLVRIWKSIVSQEYNVQFDADKVLNVIRRMRIDFEKPIDHEYQGTRLIVK